MKSTLKIDAAIDAAIEKILRAAGSSLSAYSMPEMLEKMRAEMKDIMIESYIQGSSDCYKVLKNDAND